ncbi:L-idonate 5-dehydrogenase [Schumannella luteola]|uniref:L-idonate 5-dehydrogenase n=1 Tax=Schumannella luteola TaxID=472059 RepID=UPI0031B6274A
MHAAGDLRIDEVDLRRPDPDEAVVRVTYGGICGSDLHYWRDGAVGSAVLRAPMVLGHEVVGTVIESAADLSGPPVGASVAVHPATPGADIDPPGRENLSRGGTYLGSAMDFPHTDGGFVHHLVVPTRMLRVVPAGLDHRRAVLAEPAAVAWHAVRQAGDVRGRSVAVVGGGPIGALSAAVARRDGASAVRVLDLFSRPVEAARELGADGVLVSDEQSVAQIEADVVIESSGSPAGLALAIRIARRAGRVIMVGLLPAGDQPVPIAAATRKELQLVGSFRFTEEMDEVVQALADGSLDVTGVVTHVVDASDAVSAFETASDARRSGKVLLSFGPTIPEDSDRR